MINLRPEQMKIVSAILGRYVPDCEVRVFGSRLCDSVKRYADLDIALVGTQKISDDILYALKESFQESDLPFRVDVLDWHAITKEFQEVIAQKYEVLHIPE